MVFQTILKRFALFCVLLISSSALADSWSLDPQFHDLRTLENIPAAVATNAEGYKVAIFRNKDKRVRIFLAIPSTSLDRLPLSGRIAAFRPDQNAAVFIERSSVSEQPFSMGDSVISLIWHGQDQAPFSGTLRDIMDSSELTVRFFTDTGTNLETVFDLNGARSFIAKALDIPETLASEDTQRALEARSLKTEAALRCYASPKNFSDPKPCMDAVERCSQKDESVFDLDSYRACLMRIE